MSFLRHLLPAWKRGIEDKRKANAAILSAINKELTDTEQETIKSKVLMSLDTATGEWLDQYGNLFGVLRQDNEQDDPYRKRITDYVKLSRGTIPAIIAAIRSFLQDYESYIDIYEPYTNIFYLNRSKLNGPDHMLGHYYTVAVIDIKIARKFPLGIVDVINEFKPAGVTVKLTYQPNIDGSIVELPLADSEPKDIGTQLRIMNGMNDRIRGHLNLTNRTGSENDGNGIFVLNKSKLNSLDVLTGSYTIGNPNYNLASFSTEDKVFSTETTIPDIILETDQLSEDFYGKTGDFTNQYAATTLNGAETSYLYFSLDLATYFDINYPDYLRDVTPSGVYTKATYLSLVDNPSVTYKIKAATPYATPSNYSVQILNLKTARWEDIDSGNVRYELTGKKVGINNFESYLSNSGVIFTRIKVLPNSAIENYELHTHFFELGFTKELGVKPNVQVFDGEVHSTVTMKPV